MIRTILFCMLGAWLLSSCAVQHPKYFMVEKMMEVEMGMTKDSVEALFELGPYNLLSMDSTGMATYTYVYRTRNVKRVPILVSRKKGLVVEGAFVDLHITYSPDGKVIHMESCTNCPRDYLSTTKINPTEIIASITTLITVTVPALLVFLSSNNN